MTCQFDGNINILLTIAAGGFGWWIVHRLNSARDRVNSERLTRTTELSKAHSALVRAGINGALIYNDRSGNVIWETKEVENAIGVIYLYGTPEQIALASEYVDSFAKTQTADATNLVDSLRDHIRDSLGLTKASGPMRYLKIKPAPEGDANRRPD